MLPFAFRVLRPRIAFAICLMFAFTLRSARPDTIHIDPSAGLDGVGTESSPRNTWTGVVFAAGNSYRQKAGTTSTQTIVITAQGTATAPIVLGAYGDGSPPLLNAGESGGMVLRDAAYVEITGFTIQTPDAAVKIVDGSHHVTVRGNTLRNCGIGVWIGNGPGPAGDTHRIADNIMHAMAYYGVAAAIGVSCRPGSETVIANNTIYDCQYHGIEISGDRYIIEGNRIWDIGKVATGGCSGVHLFSGVNGGFPNAQPVRHCIIRYNFCADAHDSVAQDGNGIQLDQHCDLNEVYQNFCFYNDGQGIILYDAAGNYVHDNVTLGNGRDPGNTHLVRSGIALYESDEEFNVLDNTVTHNVALATDSAASAIAFRTANGQLRGNLIGENFFQHTAGGSVYTWMRTTAGSDAATWNNTLAVGGGDDKFAGIPLLSDAQVTSYDYRFDQDEPYHTAPVLTIDGVTRTIVGWIARAGVEGIESALVYAASGGGSTGGGGTGGGGNPGGGNSGGGTAPPPTSGGGGGGGGAPSAPVVGALGALLLAWKRRHRRARARR